MYTKNTSVLREMNISCHDGQLVQCESLEGASYIS